MRMPQTPPDFEKILDENRKGLLSKKNISLALKFNSGYLHWDEVRRRETEGVDHAKIWAVMKLFRSDSSRSVSVGGVRMIYSYVEDFQRQTHKFDIYSVNLISDDGVENNRRMMYSVSSLMEESIASSQIEGANTTIDVAKKMLRDKRAPKNRAELMIHNNYAAMELIKRRKDEPLTPELMLDVHKVITKGTLDDPSGEGEFRRNNDIVISDALTGDVYHRPIDFEKIPWAVMDLCGYINNDDMFVHPLIKGTILHFMTAYIHPFADGNGRLSRSLFYWYMMKKGYPLIEYLAVSKAIKNHRGKYDLAYLHSETDGNDITYFIKFNLDCIEESLNIFFRYLDRKLKEQKALEKSVMTFEGINMRQKMILNDAAKDRRPFSIYEVQSKYQISYQTARTDVLGLIESGKIEEYGRVGNKKMYMFSDTQRKT